MERGRVDRDIVETWLGDEADDPAKSGGGDDNEDSWPIPENVPYEVDWADFLAHHHWSDEVVLDRQEAIHVHRMWVIYEYQLATGLLQPPSLF